jgi:hypothetical protein
MTMATYAGEVGTATCCSDAAIAPALGIPVDRSRNGLLGFDAAFTGAAGARFGARVKAVATRVGLDPGLLATNLLAEIQQPAAWLSAAPIRSFDVGVDYWHEEQRGIRALVPAAAAIRQKVRRDQSGRPIHFINEVGRDTGPTYVFASGGDGMLALASAVAYRNVRLRRSLPAGAYDRMSPAVRFAAVRAAFNVGFSVGLKMIQQAAAGRDPLIRRGPVGPRHPRRTATVRAGQAIHLSCAVFGNALPCP